MNRPMLAIAAAAASLLGALAHTAIADPWYNEQYAQVISPHIQDQNIYPSPDRRGQSALSSGSGETRFSIQPVNPMAPSSAPRPGGESKQCIGLSPRIEDQLGTHC